MKALLRRVVLPEATFCLSSYCRFSSVENYIDNRTERHWRPIALEYR
jgi:hypothetical protein